MATVIICLILIAIAVVAVRGYKKRLSSGCCGSGSEPSIKHVKIKDKNLEHYPYSRVLWIDGMSCYNCSTRVENSLNSLEGVWARVDLMKGQADVYMKQELSDGTLKEAVDKAGYKVYKVTGKEA